MKISVILCTYNRCLSLAKALESVLASEVPESIQWEVLVVDNNSKDQTRDVIEGYCSRFPQRIRYVFEARQGKSHALNTGIQEARGNILAFMDDDVIVEPKWLQNLTAPLHQGEWAGAGGRILSQKEFAVSDWLSLEGEHSLSGMLALFDLGDDARELTIPPFGTNMAYHKVIFEKYGGFRTDMGPCPGSEIRNEDTEFGRRLLSAGERLWYEPSAVVYHAVPENRLKQKYFLRFWFDHGRAGIRERGRRPDVWGIPRWFFSIPTILLRPLPIRVFCWLWESDPKERFYNKGLVWMTFGQLVEIPKLWFDGKRQRKSSSGKASTVPPSHHGPRELE
jgi:glycosyltransferase involved in cell wall biosynthesis